MDSDKRIAIADSGGTKTKWIFDIDGQHNLTIETDGLHPKEISKEKQDQIKTLLDNVNTNEYNLHFYGAGCSSLENKEIINKLLQHCGFEEFTVESDLLGACRATLGNKMGNVAIMGTGAIGAHYSGDEVVITSSGLGYILGDSGSGFDLGKRLLIKYYNKVLGSKLNETIEDYFGGKQNILNEVYGKTGRKKVAGLTRIISEFKNSSHIEHLLYNAFEEFYDTTILPLPKLDSIHLTGGVSYVFEDELRSFLNTKGLRIKTIVHNPAEVLFDYHTVKMPKKSF